MGTIYITRHGQTKWNLEGRLQGQLDSDLTKIGKFQAKYLANRLREEDIDLIISSASQRAIETSKIVKEYLEVPVIECDNLKEMHFGKWQGKTHPEIEKLWPIEKQNFWERPERIHLLVENHFKN